MTNTAVSEASDSSLSQSDLDISDADIRFLLNKSLAETIPLAFLGGALVYGIGTPGSLLLPADDQHVGIFVLNLFTAITFAIVAIVSWRKPIPAHWSHPLLSAGFCLLIANTMTRNYYMPDFLPYTITIALFAAGSLFNSLSWYLGLSALAIAVAGTMRWMSAPLGVINLIVPSTVVGALGGLAICLIGFQRQKLLILRTVQLENAASELKQSLTDVERDRAMYGRLLDSIGAAVSIYGIDGIVRYANQRFDDYFGPDARVFGTPCADSNIQLYEPDGSLVSSSDSIVSMVAKSGSGLFGYLVGIRGTDSGEHQWGRMSASPILGSEGTVEGVVITFVDITHERSTESLLRRTEERFHAIFEYAPDATFLLSPTGEFLECNRLAETLFGFPKQVMIGNNVLDAGLISRAETEELRRILRDLQARESADALYLGSHEFTVRRLDSARIPIEVSAHLMTMDDEPIVLAIARDISQRRQTEARIRKNEKLLEQSQQSAKIGGWELDVGTGQSWWTREMYRIHGMDPAEEPLLSDAVNFYGPGALDRLAHATREAIEHQKPYDLLLPMTTRRGENIWIRIVATPDVKDGRTVRIFSTLQDVTEQIQAEEALRAAKEQAEQASRAKSAFLANVSHEIRTPLNGILGMTELVLLSELSPENRSKLETSLKSGRSLLAVLNDVLDLSRIEAGGLELEAIPFAPQDVIAEIQALIEHQAASKGLEMSIRVEDTVPEYLVGDPTRFRQILLNLLANAVKFTHAGGVKTVLSYTIADAMEPSLTLGVADTGIGISPEHLELIFEPFTQADSSVTRRFGGTGLGLAVVRRLTELAGGTIQVESTLNAGTTFRVSLPFTPATEETTELLQSKTASESPSNVAIGTASDPAGRASVLVVEDNEINREVMSMYLEELRCECETAANGMEALELLGNGKSEYALIFMDIQMPGIDGFETTRALRARDIQIPIIALTGHAMTGFREDCIAAGMSDYLSKPVTLDAIRQMIEKFAAS